MTRALLIVALLASGCSATKNGIRTIGGPEEAGGQQLTLKVKGVDLSKFTLSLVPQAAGATSGSSGDVGTIRPIPPPTPDSRHVPAVYSVPPEAPKEIPGWLVQAADAGDPAAIRQLATWLTEIRRRKP